jgi:hypothetical protein
MANMWVHILGNLFMSAMLSTMRCITYNHGSISPVRFQMFATRKASCTLLLYPSQFHHLSYLFVKPHLYDTCQGYIMPVQLASFG